MEIHNQNIEARAWCKIDNTMIPPMTIQNMIHQKVNEFTIDQLNNELIFMMSTGSKANGKKIFVGDIIVSDNVLPDRNKPFVVESKDGMFCIKRKFPYGFMPDYTPLHRFSEDCHLRIIGNIYENPELLSE